MKRISSLNNQRNIWVLALLCCLCLSRAGATDSINVQQQSASAPPATSQFGRLVGKWKIRDFAPGADGSWNELGGADWNFYWILGGAAIQDDWISPGMDSPAPVAGRQFGTNIRIYNPKLERWEMAWASNTGAKVDTFLATHEDGSLVMKGLYNGG